LIHTDDARWMRKRFLFYSYLSADGVIQVLPSLDSVSTYCLKSNGVNMGLLHDAREYSKAFEKECMLPSSRAPGCPWPHNFASRTQSKEMRKYQCLVLKQYRLWKTPMAETVRNSGPMQHRAGDRSLRFMGWPMGS